MNKRTLEVLSVISNISKDGESAVIESSDFFDAIPDLKANELDEIIKELAVTECITLRYHKDDDYCLTTLPKGKIIAENDLRIKKGSKKELHSSYLNVDIDYKRIGRISFGAGFLGAFIAGIILLGVYFILEIAV
ncbi:MAG: hypothetical protein LBF68_03980 [Christensenellaceae bacterium]|jgi:hypothetical protein|nr:hypothetical protein [Christensenellaceae bacterium]